MSLTLDDYNEKILMPVIKNGFKNGQFDSLLKSQYFSEILEMYSNNEEMLNLVLERLVIIVKKEE